MDKFMGDGFLALFGYPFNPDEKKSLQNAFDCACQLIACTQKTVCDSIATMRFSKPETGALRCGISSGPVYTAPTSTLNQGLYLHFFIVSDAIIEATRIQSATSPNSIGVASDCAQFISLTGETKKTEIKERPIYYTQYPLPTGTYGTMN